MIDLQRYEERNQQSAYIDPIDIPVVTSENLQNQVKILSIFIQEIYKPYLVLFLLDPQHSQFRSNGFNNNNVEETNSSLLPLVSSDYDKRISRYVINLGHS